MVSIRKLAELAGVSHIAVWYALHNKPGVNPEARARILALAEELHYHPNRLVGGLISGQSRTIGYITEDSRWYFCAQVGAGIIHAAYRDQVNVITLNSAPVNSELAERIPLAALVSQLIEQRVDGIIIIGGGRTFLPAKTVLEMWSHDIHPVVLFDTMSEKPLDCVMVDERRLAQIVVEYLRQLGHQRIAYYGVERRRKRSQELERAFQINGLSQEYFRYDGFLTAPNAAIAEEYLDEYDRTPHPPTAIICYEDHIATQLLLHAQQRGLRVPGDLSIIGCANDVLCGYLTPALTSVELHMEEIGRYAYELIQRRRREGDVPGKRLPETIFVSPKLVMRESCGPPDSRKNLRFQFPGNRSMPDMPEHDALTAQDTAQVRPRLVRLLAICTGAQSKRELMAQLGLRHGNHFSTAYLLPALHAGYLERTISAKPRSGLQRYRLTEKGISWMRASAKGEG